MYSRIICIKDCDLVRVKSRQPERFNKGEIFSYSIVNRFIGADRKTPFLEMSIQDLNSNINYPFNYYVETKVFDSHFKLKESATLPVDKYDYKIE